MIAFDGEFYDGETSSSRRVTASVEPASLRVEDEQGRLLRNAAPKDLVVSPRLANTQRTIRFTDGAALETANNDAVDAMVLILTKGGTSLSRWELLVHRLESSRNAAVLSLGALLLLGIVGFVWGVPLVSRHVANSIPDAMANDLGQGTLATLDQLMFQPSNLSNERKAALRAEFLKMAQAYPSLPLTLEFRSAMPNAFALPNGTVVVTDELVELSENDNEILAVLAHEIGHVHERHALRMALESSFVALFALTYLGDASQASVIAGSLPTVYANSHFSRRHETEADTFALDFLARTNVPRHHFADILRRLHSELGGGDEGIMGYFASHPGLEERAARFFDATPSSQVLP
jgi:Zn-dependent protease with chaperone function